MPNPHPQYGKLTTDDVPIPESTMTLKCSECGKTHEYAVGKIVVNPAYFQDLLPGKAEERLRNLYKLDWSKWVSFTGYFVCPNCGSGGPWKFPAEAKRDIGHRVMREAITPGDSGVFMGRLTLFDGMAPRTCFEGVAHLNRLIAADPTNAYLWNRLGNLFIGADQPELAFPAFQRANELEPRCVETIHSLGDYWFHKDDYPRAAEYLNEVLRLCRTGIWHNERLKENVVEHTLELLLQMRYETDGAIEVQSPMPGTTLTSTRGQPRSLIAQEFDLTSDADRKRLVASFLHGSTPDARKTYSHWEKARTPAYNPKRVGRNEPCPCGSGKKFKHCCLTK